MTPGRGAPARPGVRVSRLLSAVLRGVFPAFSGPMALFADSTRLRRPPSFRGRGTMAPLVARRSKRGTGRSREPRPTSCPTRQNLPFCQPEPLPAGGKNAGSELKIPVDKKSFCYKSLSISVLRINKIFLAYLVSELLRHRQTRAQANDSSSYP